MSPAPTWPGVSTGPGSHVAKAYRPAGKDRHCSPLIGPLPLNKRHALQPHIRRRDVARSQGKSFYIAVGLFAEPRHCWETRTVLLQMGQGHVCHPPSGNLLPLQCMSFQSQSYEPVCRFFENLNVFDSTEQWERSAPRSVIFLPQMSHRVSSFVRLLFVPGKELRWFGLEQTSPTLVGLKQAVVARTSFSLPTSAPHRWAGEFIHLRRLSRYVRLRQPTRGSRPMRANRSSRAASHSMSRKPLNFSAE